MGSIHYSRCQKLENGEDKDCKGVVGLPDFDPPFISPSPQCLAVPINFDAIALTFKYVFGSTLTNHSVSAQIQSSFAVSVCKTISNSATSATRKMRSS